jgi:hypothetical protein
MSSASLWALGTAFRIVDDVHDVRGLLVTYYMSMCMILQDVTVAAEEEEARVAAVLLDVSKVTGKKRKVYSYNIHDIK